MCVVAMQVVGGGGVTSVFSSPLVAASFRQSSPPLPPPPPCCSVPPRPLLRLLPPRPAWASSSILHLRCNKKIPLRICCRGQELPSPRRRTTRTRTMTTIGGPELPQTSSSSSSASSSGLQDLDNWKGDGEGEPGFEGERDTSDGEELFQLYGVAPLVLVYSAIAEAGSGGYSQASYYTSLGLFLLSLPGVWSLVKRSTKSKVCLSVCLILFLFFFAFFQREEGGKILSVQLKKHQLCCEAFSLVILSSMVIINGMRVSPSPRICMACNPVPKMWKNLVAQVVKKTFLVQGSTMEQGKSPRQIAAEISSFFTRNNFLVTGRGDTITWGHTHSISLSLSGL